MAPPALDHIIILVPHHLLANLPPSLTSAFTVTRGGKHADGLTENKLVILRDGSYLELIAFVPPPSSSSTSTSARDEHWWGRKLAGIIDYALTSPSPPSSFPAAYDPPCAGGRTRPDGAAVEWLVTFPSHAFERGAVPFWCHDVTPRALRVPVDDEDKAAHPCGAVGVRRLEVRVPQRAWDEALKAYEDLPGADIVSNEDGSTATLTLGTVAHADEAVEVKLVRDSERERVSFGELVLRAGAGAQGSERVQTIELELEGGPLRIRVE
ncbi:hypothetical protein JCM9279_000528 [Rhodotorula babjevae]